MAKNTRKPSGKIMLKKRNMRLRIAKTMRIFVSVQVCPKAIAPSLLAQAAPGQFDKHVLERRRKHFQALQFVVVAFQLLYERDDGLRRPPRIKDVRSFKCAGIGDAFHSREDAVLNRARRAHLDTRGSGGSLF